MLTSQYSTRELLDDVQGSRGSKGYGRVFYVACGTQMVHVGSSGAAAPRLAKDKASCFVGSLYAYVETNRRVTLYRWYDEAPAPQAKRLGPWWSPHRPSAEIDKTFLAELHKTARSDFALQRSWNPMHSVVEADLAPRAQVYVGRIAKQLVRPSGEVLQGGFIQFFLPSWSLASLQTIRDHRWVK